MNESKGHVKGRQRRQLADVTLASYGYVGNRRSLLPNTGLLLRYTDRDTSKNIAKMIGSDGATSLKKHRIDIWQLRLRASGGEGWTAQSLLSIDELKRANKFRFDVHRDRFITARSAVRQILGGYADIPPARVVFSYGAKGKPTLAGGLEHVGITFNLSHSGDIGLLAVTNKAALGVDLEKIVPELATDEIATRYFSPNEVAQWRTLNSEQKSEAFFACWTRKEAYIKALGLGLSMSLDSFDVSFRPGEPATLLGVRSGLTEASRWTLYDLPIGKGYRAALAAEGRSHELRYFQWQGLDLFCPAKH